MHDYFTESQLSATKGLKYGQSRESKLLMTEKWTMYARARRAQTAGARHPRNEATNASKPKWQRMVDEGRRNLSDRFAPIEPQALATPEEIASLRWRAAERGLALDESYLNELLPYSNGIAVNGMGIPGALLDPRPRAMDDFVGYNERKSFRPLVLALSSAARGLLFANRRSG